MAEIVEQYAKRKNELKGYEGQVKAAKSLLIDEFDKIKTATDELKQLERERAIVVREIADRKKRYEGWTIKEMDKVAKKVIKNKLIKLYLKILYIMRSRITIAIFFTILLFISFIKHKL